MKKEQFTEKEAKELINGKLSRYFGVAPAEARKEQLYKAVVMSIRDIMLEKRQAFHQKKKEAKAKGVYYLCMEFLMGRSLKNSIFNLGLVEVYKEALKDYDVTLEELYELEPDAGLGNGGLGRLAACFMDGLATQDYPAMGFSIRYDYGLFKQKIVDGWQTELPDVWLPGGEVWLTQRSDKIFTVKFDGYIEEKWTEHGLETIYRDAKEIQAVAYDMMVSGYDSEAISVLRLCTGQRDLSDNLRGSYRVGNKVVCVLPRERRRDDWCPRWCEICSWDETALHYFRILGRRARYRSLLRPEG